MPRDAGEAASPVGRRDSGQSWDVPPRISVLESRSSYQAGEERAPPIYSFEKIKKEKEGKGWEIERRRMKNLCACRSLRSEIPTGFVRFT
jgi:hypothetical protein